MTISFRSLNGLAETKNYDYIAKTGTLTFNPSETTKTITIEVKGDSKKEADATFYLDLFDNSSNSLFTKGRSLRTILDHNGEALVLTLANDRVTASENSRSRR